jgi:anaerobic ribonucleoside-triphosphate reductase activating protein
LNIRVNKAHYPVTVLGYGRRIGIWLQGCPIRCEGCISTDTWEDDPEREMTVEVLLEWCRNTVQNEIDGLTITGGEPFHQADALLSLLEGFHQWKRDSAAPLDILCYSGYDLAYLERHHSDLLLLLDAVIPGPFCADRPMVDPLCGSGNQSVVPLSPLGKVLYGKGARFTSKPGQLQFQADREGLWLIGVPERNAMNTFRARCAEKGLIMEDTSWDK